MSCSGQSRGKATGTHVNAAVIIDARDRREIERCEERKEMARLVNVTPEAGEGKVRPTATDSRAGGGAREVEEREDELEDLGDRQHALMGQDTVSRGGRGHFVAKSGQVGGDDGPRM